MTKRLMLAGLAIGLAGASGCEAIDLFRGVIDPGPPKQKIGDRVVMVLPFSGHQVLRRHRDIERDLGAALTAELEAVFDRTTFIPAEDVHAWKEKNPGWDGVPAPAIGKELNAGLVVEVNIVEFQTRPRADSVLVQGVLVAEAFVVDVETTRILWRMGRVRFTWPQDTTHTIYDTSEEAAKAKVIARFAEQFTLAFARRFDM